MKATQHPTPFINMAMVIAVLVMPLLAEAAPSQEVSRVQVEEAQDLLQQQGFHAGKVDGLWGPQTRQAVLSFQQSKGLQATGELDQQTLDAIGVPSMASMMKLPIPDRTRAIMERVLRFLKRSGEAWEFELDETHPTILYMRIRGKNITERFARKTAEGVATDIIKNLMHVDVDPEKNYVPITVAVEEISKSITGKDKIRPLGMALFMPEKDALVWRPWDGTLAGAVPPSSAFVGGKDALPVPTIRGYR